VHIRHLAIVSPFVDKWHDYLLEIQAESFRRGPVRVGPCGLYPVRTGVVADFATCELSGPGDRLQSYGGRRAIAEVADRTATNWVFVWGEKKTIRAGNLGAVFAELRGDWSSRRGLIPSRCCQGHVPCCVVIADRGTPIRSAFAKASVRLTGGRVLLYGPNRNRDTEAGASRFPPVARA